VLARQGGQGRGAQGQDRPEPSRRELRLQVRSTARDERTLGLLVAWWPTLHHVRHVAAAPRPAQGDQRPVEQQAGRTLKRQPLRVLHPTRSLPEHPKGRVQRAVKRDRSAAA